MAEISSIGSAGLAAPAMATAVRVVPSLAQTAADQLQQSEQAFEAALTERNRAAAVNTAAAVGLYSRQGRLNQTQQESGQLRTSA